MTPTTPRGLRSGKANAAWSPLRRAASARGKFASWGASAIQAGSPVETTRPGRPSPGERTSRSLIASNSRAPSPVCQVLTQRSLPSSGSTSQTEPTSQPSDAPITWRTAAYASSGCSCSARIRATACSTRWRSSRSAIIPSPLSRSVMPANDVTSTESHPPRPNTLRVVVADDHALLREGIASLLEEAGHVVVGRAVDADDLLLKVRSHTPDVAIVDVRMPPRNIDDGFVAAAEIRRTQPNVGVLVLSQHLEPSYMLELVGQNASGVGYLLKDRVRDVGDFLDAVERVAHGGTAFDPDVVKALVGGHQRSALDELTERERAVLSLLAEGCSNRAIAKKLYLSTRAVERHVQSIFEKLRLPDTEDDNRRVLAVLALLGP